MENLVDGAIAPDGVELRALHDYDSLRRQTYDGVKKAVIESFPQSYNGYRMEVSDVDYEGPEIASYDDQKKALLQNKYLARKLRGNVRLVDEKTGDVLDEQRMSLMRVPMITERGSTIHGGNEYYSIMQERLLPGIYTRRQENGGLETQVNPRPTTGRDIRVGFDPETQQYRLKISTSDLHLYSLLKDIGYDDEDLKKRWGEELFDANSGKYDARVFEKAFQKLVPPHLRREKSEYSRDEKARMIREAFDRIEVNRRVAERNLPGMFNAKLAQNFLAQHLGRVLADKEMVKVAEALDFVPDITAERVAGDFWWQIGAEPATADFLIDGPAPVKSAALLDEFKPDLGEKDMREAYNALYAGVGPRLAGMKAWPEKWYSPEADQMGWVSWYRKFADGMRTDDDDRQIQRWKRFKAREGAKFRRNPTARLGFSLRNWAIDPLKLLDRPEDRKRLAAEMADYKSQETQKYLAKKAAFSVPEIRAIAQFLNREHGAGLDVSQPAPVLEEQLLEYIMGDGDVDAGLLQAGIDGAEKAYDDVVEMSKSANEGDPLSQMQLAKAMADQKRYGAKQAILYGLMKDRPESFVVDSDEGDIVGITHVPTGFQIHTRKAAVPAEVGARKRAVIIKGNPEHIQDNELADKFYGDLEGLLGQSGYSVQFDAGEPKTEPPAADLWVGHSRGGDRLRFAPPTTRTVRVDDFQTWDGEDPRAASHYELTEALRDALRGEKATNPPGIPQSEILKHAAEEKITPVEHTWDEFFSCDGRCDKCGDNVKEASCCGHDQAAFLGDPNTKCAFDDPTKTTATKQASLAPDQDNSAFQAELNQSSIPADITFFVGGDRVEISPGDWHDEDEVAAAEALAHQHFNVVDTEPEAGRPSWATEVMTKESVVKKRGDKWVLLTKDESRALGTHDSAEEAYAQEYAIQKSEERRKKAAAPEWDGYQQDFSDPEADVDSVIERLQDQLGSGEITEEEALNRFRYVMWGELPGSREKAAKEVQTNDIKKWTRGRRMARMLTEEPKSEAQAEAGNYPKGKFFMRGLEFTIENKRGSTRRGWNSDGSVAWECEMKSDYGYVRRTESERDGDHIDVFIGENLESDIVYVIDQIDQKTGKFDEHKCMVGYQSMPDAKKAYLDCYTRGWKVGKITPITFDQFKDWCFNGDTNKEMAKTRFLAKVARVEKTIAVDLDGTWAKHVPGDFDPRVIGKPIPEMTAKIRRWLREGKRVVVFTARAAKKSNIPHVKSWMLEHDLPELEVTNEKTPDMVRFYDDRARHVKKDTGKLSS